MSGSRPSIIDSCARPLDKKKTSHGILRHRGRHPHSPTAVRFIQKIKSNFFSHAVNNKTSNDNRLPMAVCFFLNSASKDTNFLHFPNNHRRDATRRTREVGGARAEIKSRPPLRRRDKESGNKFIIFSTA